MGENMNYPENPVDFINQYSFIDKHEIYTNGAEVIPVFRVGQMLEHYMSDLTPQQIKDMQFCLREKSRECAELRKRIRELEEGGKDKDGWIPVGERLPENAKHKGALCPRYQLMTKYGVTEGWYNPDLESWYILIWFMTERYLDSEIDFERGTWPKIVRCENKVNDRNSIVMAWRPLLDPYKPKQPETCKYTGGSCCWPIDQCGECLNNPERSDSHDGE